MIVPLASADSGCGAKALNLGRLLRAGFRVPDGFVIPDPYDDRWLTSLEQDLVALGPATFAVRSSAGGEDGTEASFAGQLHTALDVVTVAEVIAAVRRVAASATDAAVYAVRSGRSLTGAVPAIVQVMVRPDAAGVLFTRHPVTGVDQVVIEAAAGRGEAVVDGTVTPERWLIDGDTVVDPGTSGRPALTSQQVMGLAQLGRRVEALFGRPQDIEWAIADGRSWVLQARPITGLDVTRKVPTAVHAAGEVLIIGTAASPGSASGAANVIRGLDDFSQFAAGDVLVCHATSPAWTPLLARASAVVTETGGLLSHAAIVAREFGIPAVLAAGDAMTVLAGGCRVIVDGTRGIVADTERSP